MDNTEKFVKATHTDEANEKRRLTMIRSGIFKGERHPRWIKDFDINKAIELYCYEGKSLREVSKILNVSRTTLRRRLKEFVSF